MLTARVVSSDVERYARWARWFALLFVTAYVLGVAIRYLAAVNLGHAIDLRRIDSWLLESPFSDCIACRIDPLPCAYARREKQKCDSLRIGAA